MKRIVRNEGMKRSVIIQEKKMFESRSIRSVMNLTEAHLLVAWLLLRPTPSVMLSEATAVTVNVYFTPAVSSVILKTVPVVVPFIVLLSSLQSIL